MRIPDTTIGPRAVTLASARHVNKHDTSLPWYTGALGAGIGLFFVHISLWIPAGLLLFGLVAGHLVATTGSLFPLPHVAVMIATIYYVIAPLVSLYFPHSDELYSLGRNPAAYFAYAVPCLFALAIGWSTAFRKVEKMIPLGRLSGINPNVTKQLDILLFFGMTAAIAASFREAPEGARFLVILVGNIRFIGLFGWILLGAPGWKLRLILVMFSQLYLSTSSGFFLDFALWCLSALVFLMNRYRPSRKTVAVAIVTGILFLPCIQYAKWEYRRSIWGVRGSDQYLELFHTNVKLTRYNKPLLLLAKTLECSIRYVTLDQMDEFLSETMIRYNQGWIVARVLNRVPKSEPFANGETIRASVVASIFPRFLMRDKMRSGGATLFTRFTGVRINANTSMNLGFVGEMYANFGYYGGIGGCGIYGFFLGSILKTLLRMSRTHPLVLTFVPFVLNFSVVSEVGLLEVLNYTVKSLWFVLAIYWAFPAVFGLTSDQLFRSSRREFRHDSQRQ